MSEIEILRGLFLNEGYVVPEQEFNSHKLVLKEEQCENLTVDIQHIPEDAFAIKADSFPAPETIFQGSQGECKRADYILIVPSKKFVIFMELKRGKNKNHIL